MEVFKLKKILALSLALFMLLCFVGCAQKPVKETETPVEQPEQTETVVGGWNAVEDGTITPELEEMFKTALNDLVGVDYTPVELLETQIVNGTNYKFLADAKDVTPDAEARQVYVYVNKASDGKVTLMDIEDVVVDEPLVGAFEPVEDGTLNDELLDIWNNAMSTGWKDVEVEHENLEGYAPVSLLAKQVVAGTNYKFLANLNNGTADTAREVVVYQDLDGNCFLLSSEVPAAE